MYDMPLEINLCRSIMRDRNLSSNGAPGTPVENSMNTKIHELNHEKIAEIEVQGVVINSAQDALDIMPEASYLCAQGVVLQENHMSEEFYDLRTGLAGDILLKFSNYRVKLAIIGDFEKYESKSLRAFIAESNQGNQVFFVEDFESAISKFANTTDMRDQYLRR
jgi:hypothetical protein